MESPRHVPEEDEDMEDCSVPFFKYRPRPLPPRIEATPIP